MRFKKKGMMGEGILMIYRLVLVSFIALAVLGLSSVFYGIVIDVKSVESNLLTRSVVECISPGGYINLEDFNNENKKSILDYCGISNSARAYVGIELKSGNEVIDKFSQGDKGLLWTKDFFEKFDKGDIQMYRPGYRNFNYPVIILSNDRYYEGQIEMEVLVRGDE